jgi:hypothetical protein
LNDQNERSAANGTLSPPQHPTEWSKPGMNSRLSRLPDGIVVIIRGVALYFVWKLVTAGTHPMFVQLPRPTIDSALALTIAILIIVSPSSLRRDTPTQQNGTSNGQATEAPEGPVEMAMKRIVGEIFGNVGIVAVFFVLFMLRN